MRTDTVDKIMLGAIALCVMFGVYQILNSVESMMVKRAVENSKPTPELCFVKRIQPGESFGESKPGTYEYHLINTTKGIEVYKKCDK